jgi:dCMP deaminase
MKATSNNMVNLKGTGMILASKRPSKREHFFHRAKVAAERSTCLRRKVGAIIVNADGVELSSGYSGAPRHMKHCDQIGSCLRMELKIPSGENYELCRSVHAEQNAIINAARIGISIKGGIMYISSTKLEGAYPDEERERKIYGPCIICKKEIVNAGLKAVHMKEDGVGTRTFTATQLKDQLMKEEIQIREKVRGRKDSSAGSTS